MTGPRISRRQAFLLAPFGVAALAGAGFYTVLGRMRAGRFDPHDVPSQLIGRSVPDFAALPAQEPGEGFGAADLRGFRPACPGQLLRQLVRALRHRASGADGSVAGRPADLGHRLQGHRRRRRRLHRAPRQSVQPRRPRRAGQVAIDWGVYGVPESYLLDKTGVVRWRMAGPLTPAVVAKQLRPVLKTLT